MYHCRSQQQLQLWGAKALDTLPNFEKKKIEPTSYYKYAQVSPKLSMVLYLLKVSYTIQI